MTAKMITWLGEDIEREGMEPTPGPSFLTWGGIRFDKGKPVLVDDAAGNPEQASIKTNILINAAANPQAYTVTDAGGKAEPPAPPPARARAKPGTKE